MVTSPEARERRRRATRLHAIVWPFFLVAAAWGVLQFVALMEAYDVQSAELPWWVRHVGDDRLRPALEAEVLLSRDLSQADLQPRVEESVSAAEKAGAAPVVVAWLRWENSLPKNPSSTRSPATPEQRQALAALRQFDSNNPWWQVLAAMVAAGDNKWGEADRLLRAAVDAPTPVGIPTLPAPWPWQLLPISSGLLPETGVISYGCQTLELYGAALGVMGQPQRAADFAALMSRLTLKLAEARWVALSVEGTRAPKGSAWQLMAEYPMFARMLTMEYISGRRESPRTPAEQLALCQRYVTGRQSMDFEMAGGETVGALGMVAFAFLLPLLLVHQAASPLMVLLAVPLRRGRMRPVELASCPVRPAVLGGFMIAAVALGMGTAIEWPRLYDGDYLSARDGIGSVLILILPLALLPMAAVFVDAAPAMRLRPVRLKGAGSGVWNMKVRPPLATQMFAHTCFTPSVVAVMLASLVGYGAVEGAIHHDHTLRAMVEPAAAMRLADEDWAREHYDGAMAELKGALAAATVEQVKAAISPQLAAEVERQLSTPRSPRSAAYRADFEQRAAAVASQLQHSGLPPLPTP